MSTQPIAENPESHTKCKKSKHIALHYLLVAQIPLEETTIKKPIMHQPELRFSENPDFSCPRAKIRIF
jgi:hypothetical protein